MKAIKKVSEKTHEILFKPYSEDVFGYSVTLDGCGHFFIINSIYEDKADEIYTKLIELSAKNFRNFILLQKNGNAQSTDNLDFLEEGGII